MSPPAAPQTPRNEHSALKWCIWCCQPFDQGRPSIVGCAYCQRHKYCSVVCQQNHFPHHKDDCDAYADVERQCAAASADAAKQLAITAKDEEISEIHKMILAKDDERFQINEGVGGYPHLSEEDDENHTYLHLLPKEKLSLELVDLFLMKIREEQDWIQEGWIDVDGEFIRTGDGRAGSFRRFPDKAKETGVLPPSWNKKSRKECQRRAVDNNQTRTLHTELRSDTIFRYYGRFPEKGLISVYSYLWPQPSSPPAEGSWDSALDCSEDLKDWANRIGNKG